jgi:hypothetical protein
VALTAEQVTINARLERLLEAVKRQRHGDNQH